MSDMLYNSAKSFDNATKYNYIFCVARSQKQFVINLSCLEGEFTHIMGLDHLKDIDILSSHNLSIKTSAFQRILSQEINFSDISKSDFFSQPFFKTYNSTTKSEYTLTERISILQDIEKILDKAYTGRLYKWNSKNATIEMPDGKKRRTNISGDYMLAIPSERNPDEKIYLFLYRDITAKKTGDMREQLYLFSAFADCLDLSRGQERPYTILQETKENTKTNESEVLYTHPSYEKNKSAQPLKQSDNIKQIKFDNPTPQNILHNNSGAAAAVLPAPNPFKNLFNGLKNLFKKQDKPVEATVTVEAAEKTAVSETGATVEKASVSKELAILNEARKSLANGNISKNEYLNVLVFYIKTLGSEEKAEKAIETLNNLRDELPPNEKRFINGEIYNIQHYLQEKYRPDEKSYLETLKTITAQKNPKTQNDLAEDKNHSVRNNNER